MESQRCGVERPECCVMMGWVWEWGEGWGVVVHRASVGGWHMCLGFRDGAAVWYLGMVVIWTIRLLTDDWCMLLLVGCLRISLHSNQIGAEGAKAIGANLRFLSSLTSLKYVRGGVCLCQPGRAWSIRCDAAVRVFCVACS